jgi:predicted XRE-type DNA-binding protein
MSKMSQVEESSGNVFADIGLPDAAAKFVRAQLAFYISNHIKSLKLTQASIGQKLGLSQPDVSRLVNGRPTGFSTDRLIALLESLGQDVDITIRPRKATTRVQIPEYEAAE